MKLLVPWLVVAAARKAKKFESATEMTPDAPAIEASKDQLFCVAPPDEAALKLVFASITWNIEFKPDSRGRARAVSDDDFHEAGRSIVGKIIGAEPGNLGKELDQKLARRPLFPMPWDSCPNPFSDCVLDLSPYGNSCARVSSRAPYKIKVVLDHILECV